jgi:cytochrome c biogenesis protein CcmG/thiol:disulfide interchange protein DsbE
VENASFMPWLVGTALIHSLAVTEKRGAFKPGPCCWPSGLFAVAAGHLPGALGRAHLGARLRHRPRARLFILAFLVVVIGGSLRCSPGARRKVGSAARFGWCRANRCCWATTCCCGGRGAVLLGTLYPLLLDALGLGKISVGPPYFDAVFVPLMAPAVLLLMGVGPLARWKVPSPLIGKPAPAFDLPRLDDPGQRVRREDLLGKVWMLNVWASWCAACRDEHPLLVEMAARKIVPIYGLDYKDTRAAGQQTLARFGDPYVASLFDADGRVGIDWGVYGVPETFIIDRQGVIRMKHIGPLTPDVIRDKIEPLVRQLNG